MLAGKAGIVKAGMGAGKGRYSKSRYGCG